MNRHAFVAHHRMVLNVKARAAHDWAWGENHAAAYANNARVHQVYANEWQELEDAAQHAEAAAKVMMAGNDNYAEWREAA